MKKIEAIIRPEKLEELKEAFYAQTAIKGITVAQVLGSGQQMGHKEYVRGQKVLPSLVPKIQVCVVVKEEDAQAVIDIILATCRTDEVGDGKIFVYEVDETIRIRTGEKGPDAV